MGILAYVYRCELGSSELNLLNTYNKVCVVNADGPFEPSDNIAPVLLQMHQPGCLRIVPAVKNGKNEWVKYPRHTAHGGNYCSTSDSRFSELAEVLLGHGFYGAVSIHDRCED